MSDQMFEDRLDQAFVRGEQSAWHSILHLVVRELNISLDEPSREAWVLERMDTVALLRQLCDEHGASNDWSDDLYLTDIITKHLMPALTRANP